MPDDDEERVVHHDTWKLLTRADRTEYLRSVAAQVPGARLVGLADFEALQTGLFDIGGATFVYVPAAKSVIGYDPASAIPLGFLELLADEMQAASVATWAPPGDGGASPEQLATARAQLTTMMAPRRSVRCRELLVEQYFAEVRYSRDPIGLRLPYPPGTIVPVGPDDQALRRRIVDTMRNQGWDVLTEDEWEYLALGQHACLLPPAGMAMLANDPTSVKSSSQSTVDCGSTQWQPEPEGQLGPNGYGQMDPRLNPFGLWLNRGGPNELVDAECLLRNGDGGSASHGGYDAYDALASSPHFRVPRAWLEFFCVRRVVDLGDHPEPTDRTEPSSSARASA